MGEKQIEESEKPLILMIGFFFHKTIAFCEGWLAPRYLIIDFLHLIVLPLLTALSRYHKP